MSPQNDGEENYGFVPPREVPPPDWTLEKQMVSYQKWLDAQGGTSAGVTNEDSPTEGEFGGLCPDCGDVELPETIYRNHFSPPLRDVDVETVPPDELPATFEYYRQRFLEQGDFLSPCEHFSRRETLRWIQDIAHSKHRVTGRGSTAIFQPTETCPECNRRSLRALCEDLGKTLLEYCEEELESMHERLEELGRHREQRADGTNWPPGARRLKILSETAVQRLEDDIADGVIPVLEGTDETILNVITGMEALSWVLGGIIQLYDEKPLKLVLRTLRGGARMIRILDDRHDEPDQRPGRFYDDLCAILPDVELIVEMLTGGEEKNVESRQDFPDPSEETPEAWLAVFREELALEYPSFAHLLQDGVTKQRVDRAHREWLHREYNREVENERAKRRIRDAFGRSVQFDPNDPVSFLEETVDPVDPVDVDPTQFDNPVLMALLMNSDRDMSEVQLDLGREESGRNSPDEPDDIDRAVHNDPYYQAIRPLKRILNERWTSVDREDRAAGVVVLCNFMEQMEDLLRRARIYQRTVDHRVPVEGAHRGVELLLQRCQAVIEFDDVGLDGLEGEIVKARKSLSDTS